jgi:hypothetical protein
VRLELSISSSRNVGSFISASTCREYFLQRAGKRAAVVGIDKLEQVGDVGGWRGSTRRARVVIAASTRSITARTIPA